MLDAVSDILTILSSYIIYIYPGVITIFVYKYVAGRKLEENSNLVIKSIVISYLYVVFLQRIKNFNSHFLTEIWPHIVLLIVSVLLPYIFYKLINADWFINILRKIGIATRSSSNPIEIALSYQKKVWARVYMDELGIVYEGTIRNYVKDDEESKYIMLSKYVISKKDENNQYKFVYPSDNEQECTDSANNKDWVILYFDNITRIEIKYDVEH